MGNRPRFILALSFCLLGAGALAALLACFSPTQLRLPPCLFHKLTGLYCPGCGATRAIRRCLCGDLVGAFRYNPLLVAVSPFLAFEILLYLRDAWRGEFPYRRGSLYAAVIVVAAIVLFTLLRNLPFDCFDWLRPPVGPCP